MDKKFLLVHVLNAAILLICSYLLYKAASNTHIFNMIKAWRGVIYLSFVLSIIGFKYDNVAKQAQD